MADLTVEELQEKLVEMQTALTKANGESADRRKTANELKTKLAEFDGIDMDKYKTSIATAEKAEQDRLKGEGKFEEALAKRMATSDQQITALQKMNEDIKADNAKMKSEYLIDNKFIMSLANNAVNPEDALFLAKRNIKMEDGEVVIYKDGKVRLNDKGDKLSIEEYGPLFLAENPKEAAAGGSGSGSQGNQGNNNTDVKTISRVEYDAMDAVAKAAHFKDGGKITD